MKRHLDPEKVTPSSAPTCWQREGPCACLRIEPKGCEAHLFPYQQLVMASLVQTELNETLCLVFASHEVEFTGRNLRDLFHALQDFAVKWVRPLPERFNALVSGDSGVVSGIRVIEAN